MKNRKILSLCLALVMMFAFSSCTNNSGQTTESTDDKQAEKTESKDDTKDTKDSKDNKESEEDDKKSEEDAKDEKDSKDESNKEVKGSGVVNLYTTRHYDSDDELYAKFEKETGIKVNVVNEKKAGALIEKIKSQGDSVQADLFITADAGNLANAKMEGILEPVKSDVLEKNIPEKYRDLDSEWFGLTKRARIMLYSKDRVTEEDLKGLDYSTLVTNPRWEDKVLVRGSSNIYNQSLVASFIKIMGQEKATEWVKGFVATFARPPQGNDRDQALAIKEGLGDLAISNSYYYGKLVNDKDPESKYAGVADVVGIYFPNDDKNGVHINVSGVGLIKKAPNKENAIRLMEYLSEVPQQEQFSSANYEFPVNPEAQMSELLKSWLDAQGITELKEQDINLSALGRYNYDALEIMTLEGWDK